jgi:hypothetical protein
MGETCALAHAWIVSNGRLMPLEFYFKHINNSHGANTINPASCKTFVSVAEERGMADLIGLWLV